MPSGVAVMGIAQFFIYFIKYHNNKCASLKAQDNVNMFVRNGKCHQRYLACIIVGTRSQSSLSDT